MNFSRFHDGKLVAIKLISDTDCDLQILTQDGHLESIRLIGVVRLVIDEFREGNIINNITVAQDVIRSQVLDHLFNVGDSIASHEAVGRFAHKIQSGELKLLEIDPSYGASVTCLCSAIIVE